MKRLFLTIIAVSCILSACDSPFVPMPYVPGGPEGSLGSGANRAPDGITATQGGKRSIELRWNEVPGAARYIIFQAKSPLESSFVQCWDTEANQVRFNVPAGSTIYYRVSAVLQNGRESPQSIWVRGTSLDQPNITDVTDVTEESVTVTWYMDNVKEDTYKKDLLYTVYCFDGSTEVAQLVLNGAELTENKASFDNLRASTQYTYQVEAYLRSDQSNSEKSDKMDAATARRLRPGKPVKPWAARGTAKNKIELSFELPDEVDIALGENRYEKKPVYFVISRRQYSANVTNEYSVACSYFGSNAGTAAAKGGKTFPSGMSYIPGAKVTWTDNTVSRGVEYEYQVQSYVDDPVKVITSDTSKASAVGWALSEGTLDFGSLSYTAHEVQDMYTSAQLPLIFDFDPKGETYDYSLVEKVEPIGDGEDSLLTPIQRPGKNLTYDGIKSYVAPMNLEQPTSVSVSGRGVYSYDVEIKLNGETIDTVATIGKVEVSENTKPIIVEGFTVEDGYTDRFVFKWKYRENRKYVISMSDDQNTWTEILTVNSIPNDDSTVEDDNYSRTYTTGITPGLTKYFRIQPSRNTSNSGTLKAGQMVYARAASQTLGVPVLSLGTDASYSIITATWTEAQKADTYQIRYWYTGEGSYAGALRTAKVPRSALDTDASGKLRYKFIPFAGNAVEVSKAGLEIQVAVDALNEGLSAATGINEISTSSKDNPVSTRLVGPALLNPQASRAASPMDIDVAWDRVTGADGYYVFRRQFNMDNTAEEGTEAIVYYVPSAGNSVTGKNLALVSGAKEDTSTVKAAASFSGSRYTLRDSYMPDGDYYDSPIYNSHTPAYRDQQNNMAQGFSYRYYIVPVINRGGAPEPLSSINFAYLRNNNINGNISNYTIREDNKDIRYDGASALEQEGFIVGFGQNVIATKGTYASSGNVNNGIQISWSLPAKLAGVAGFNARYTLYRKAYRSSTWEPLVNNVSDIQYVDNQATRGVAYEYVVGITNGAGTGSEPHKSRRFIERCGTLRDEKYRPHYLGYTLEMVKMNSVSKDERKGSNGNFGEMVNWYAGGVKTDYSADNNWGVDGYTIFVMNRNLNASWHEIADITNLSDQINQSFLVTTGMGSYSFTSTGVSLNFDLLRVMRDYKHYFKVRSYVKDGEKKVYCPDPPYNFNSVVSGSGVNSLSGSAETEYVKWGARQITTDEFITIATLYMANGLMLAKGTGTWPTNWSYMRWYDAGGGGCSGRIGTESNFGVSSWDIRYENLRDDLQLRTGEWALFVTINGKFWAATGAAQQHPRRYGDADWLNITGPSDTPGLYTGQLRIGGSGYTDMEFSNNGTVRVIYPAGTAQQNLTRSGRNTPFPYHNEGGDRINLEDYK